MFGLVTWVKKPTTLKTLDWKVVTTQRPIVTCKITSFNHIRSINVALGPVYLLACQRHLLLRKNSTTDVLVVFMFWIIICANYIFTLYAFLSAHPEDDDECDGNLTANG